MKIKSVLDQVMREVVLRLLPVILTDELPQPESTSDHGNVMFCSEFSRIRLDTFFSSHKRLIFAVIFHLCVFTHLLYIRPAYQ